MRAYTAASRWFDGSPTVRFWLMSQGACIKNGEEDTASSRMNRDGPWPSLILMPEPCWISFRVHDAVRARARQPPGVQSAACNSWDAEKRSQHGQPVDTSGGWTVGSRESVRSCRTLGGLVCRVRRQGERNPPTLNLFLTALSSDAQTVDTSRNLHDTSHLFMHLSGDNFLVFPASLSALPVPGSSKTTTNPIPSQAHRLRGLFSLVTGKQEKKVDRRVSHPLYPQPSVPIPGLTASSPPRHYTGIIFF
jgi:hypothetical protein